MPSQPNDSVGKLVIEQAEPPIDQADALIVADQASHRQHGWLPRTIISGGQTGADRAALDWARSHGIAHGGWCPKGRLAADGVLPLYFQLRETESAGYRQRTRLNVRDSDATLIFNTKDVDGGTLQTVRFAETMHKPYCVVQLDGADLAQLALQVVEWLKQRQFATLNIAGPREEKRPGIYALVTSVLDLCVGADAPLHSVVSRMVSKVEPRHD